MKRSVLAWAAPLALGLCGVPAVADDADCPTITRVAVQNFTLRLNARQRVNDCEIRTRFNGQTVILVPRPGQDPLRLRLRIKLDARTLLNEDGDGLTDGKLQITDLDTRQSFKGRLAAVNENSDTLLGVLDGRIKRSEFDGRLRLVFQATFTRNSNGDITGVTISARGVLVSGDHRGNDEHDD